MRLQTSSAPKKTVFRLSCLAIALQTLPASLQAQTQETALPTIRVKAEPEPAMPLAKRSSTATKTDTPVAETAQSISVVTREEMEARRTASAREAVAYTAGVTNMFAAENYDQLSLRGLPVTQVLYYMDGLVMPWTSLVVSRVEPYGLERIEVLRGPSSMVYGQAPAGGLVNMVSKRPTEVSQREVRLSLGSHDRREAAFDAGGPLGQGSEWSYRLTGLVRKSKTPVEFMRDDRTFLAAALAWRPSARTTLTLRAGAMDNDAGPTFGTQSYLPASGTGQPNPSGRIAPATYGGEPGFDRSKVKQHSVGYELVHAFNDTWTLQQRVRADRLTSDLRATPGLLGLHPLNPRILLRGAFASTAHNDLTGADTGLQAKWGSGRFAHTSLVGVDLRRSRSSELEYFGLGPAIDIFAPVYGAQVVLPTTPYVDQQIEARQVGVYAQDQLKIDQRWLLTLGVRRDVASDKVEDTVSMIPFDRKVYQTTWRAGLSYLLNDGVMPYVSVATSFQPNTTPNPFGAPFDGRLGKQREVGVKVQPPGSNSLYTAALFDLTQTNTFAVDPDQANHPLGVLQIDEFRSRGLELEAKTSLSRSLDLVGSYTYLDAKFTRSRYDNVGGSPAGVPEHSTALWLDYKVTGALSAGAGLRHMSSRPNWSMNAGRFHAPSFTMVDAAVRYRVNRVELALNIQNLTDKETLDCAGQQCWFGAPRNVVGTLTYRW